MTSIYRALYIQGGRLNDLHDGLENNVHIPEPTQAYNSDRIVL